MPIQEDIRDHDYFGPLIRRERAAAKIRILLLQIEKRFGAISPKLRKRLEALTPDQIDAVALRLLDAHWIEELFAQ